MGSSAHSCDQECTGTCFSSHLFLSSMIQGDPLYSPSSCCFGSAWPGVGCPGGTAEAEARAFAQPVPSSAPRAFHFCFPHSLLVYFSRGSFRPTWSRCRRAWKWKTMVSVAKFTEKNGGLTLSCFKNIYNVRSFIIQYIVPKQLVEKILFSITF